MKKIILAFIILLTLVGYRISLEDKKVNEKPTNQIEVSGIVEYKKVDLSFKIPGQINKIFIDEGVQIKKGETIAELDIEDFEIQKEKLEKIIELSKSRIPQIKSTIDFQNASYESQMKLANAAIDTAKAQLKEVLAGTRKERIKQAQALHKKAKLELKRVENDYVRFKKLFAEKATTKQKLDNLKTMFLAAKEQVKSAKENYDLAKNGASKENIDIIKAKVKQTEAQIAVIDSMKHQIKRLEQELITINKDIEVKKVDLKTVAKKIRDSKIYAPFSGTILEKYREESEITPASSPIAVISDIKNIWIRGYVQETDLGKIKLGQDVGIKTDSYENKEYKGNISFISPEAEFTPKNVQTKKERVKLVYRIKIDINNESGDLKLGMPVEAFINLK